MRVRRRVRRLRGRRFDRQVEQIAKRVALDGCRRLTFDFCARHQDTVALIAACSTTGLREPDELCQDRSVGTVVDVRLHAEAIDHRRYALRDVLQDHD